MTKSKIELLEAPLRALPAALNNKTTSGMVASNLVDGTTAGGEPETKKTYPASGNK